MNITIPDNYVPYSSLFLAIEPENDIIIKFLLSESTFNEIATVNCKTITLADCKKTLIKRNDLQDAILHWIGCVNKQFDLEEADVVVNDADEIISISFPVDYADLSNANTFRLGVVLEETERILARGRVYIEL